MGNVNWADWIGVNETRERGRLKIFTHQWKESIKLIRRVRLDDRPTGCLGVQLTREIKLTVNVRARSSTESTNQRPTSDRRICIAKQRISVNDTAAAADFKRRKRMKRFFFLIFHSHPSEVGPTDGQVQAQTVNGDGDGVWRRLVAVVVVVVGSFPNVEEEIDPGGGAFFYITGIMEGGGFPNLAKLFQTIKRFLPCVETAAAVDKFSSNTHAPEEKPSHNWYLGPDLDIPCL
ncbi:hypothetical protein T01_714 [Trichinella spiralis]|uniref:Uncharacterized protein n=1 Tax=Trichinella spiralis TaxID=6334 RepID=A0A0V1BL47_TRISP|nr:hypothetical protein T01_714 [Trichinella spiralis]